MKKASVVIDKDYVVSKIDRRIYGSFVEHLGRCVYGGIYDPDHETADEMGFRTDVLDMTRQLKIPIVRYPGGNFVSSYIWEDGVGPVSERPHRHVPAWHTIESNRIGTNEFHEWAKKADTEVMMAVNLGNRGPSDAANLVEYCNYKGGTYYSDLRKTHGYEAPHGYKTWCLGNEMDGSWQVGHKTADEYGRIAYEAAREMKWVDPSIELVACGSSGAGMDTFPQWEATVLDHCYDTVEYISLHAYYDIWDGDSLSFMGCAMEMDHFIKTIGAVCDYIKAKKRGTKNIYISFDEWNVWFQTRHRENPGKRMYYSLQDAVVFGTLLNTLIRNSDRVKIGCQAQLVNVTAPICTEKNGPAWKEAIYYPYQYASLYGQGTTLQAIVDSPKYDSKTYSDVPYLDIAITYDEAVRDGSGGIAIFAVNRDLEEEMTVEIDLRQFSGYTVKEHVTLFNEDMSAKNTGPNPTVIPIPLNNSRIDEGKLIFTLPKHSWNFIRMS